jgi:hypothetical protein
VPVREIHGSVSHGDFFTKIFHATIAMSLKLRPERLDTKNSFCSGSDRWQTTPCGKHSQESHRHTSGCVRFRPPPEQRRQGTYAKRDS